MANYDQEIQQEDRPSQRLQTELDSLEQDLNSRIDATNQLLVKFLQDYEKLRERFDYLEKSDRYVFQKAIQLLEGRNIQLGVDTGTRFGTATNQKAAFYGVTAVVQAGAISAPATQGGSYVQADVQSIVTAVNSLRTALINFGITA